MPEPSIPLLEGLSDPRVTDRRFDHPAFAKPQVIAGDDARFEGVYGR